MNRLLNYEIQKQGLALLKWGERHFSSPPLLSSAFMEELALILDRLERDKPKALIAFSEHPSAFCAGADLKELLSLSSKEEMKSLLDRGGEIFSRLEQLKCPKIALIQAACLGGGLELALCFDFLILEDGEKTRLAFPELKLGLIPALGGLSKLLGRVGLKNSLSILLKAKSLKPQQALNLGLVDEAPPPFMAKKRAFQLVHDLMNQESTPSKKFYRGRHSFSEDSGQASKKKLKLQKDKQLFSKNSGQAFTFPKKLYRDRQPFSFLMECLFKELIGFQARRQLIKTLGRFYPAPFETIKLLKRSYGFFPPSDQRMKKREREVFCKLFQSYEAQNLMRLFLQGMKAKKKLFHPHPSPYIEKERGKTLEAEKQSLMGSFQIQKKRGGKLWKQRS